MDEFVESAKTLFRIVYGMVRSRLSTLTFLQSSVLFWIFVVVPLIILVIVRLATIWLRRTAKQAIIQVKKLKETVSQGHFLDLDPNFIERLQHHEKFCRVTSLASYLGALDYGGNQDVAYRIITTLASTLAGDSFLPLLPLIPASMIPKESAVRTSGLLARFTLTEFPSILTLAATVDAATQFSKQDKQQPDGNIELPRTNRDSMDILALGEAPGVVPELPPSLVANEPLHLSSSHTLRAFVENGMILGEKPDAKRYDFPKPFSPSLLPGLCSGYGGLESTVTPRMGCQNRVLAAILNKLSANFMGWTGFGPFDSVDKPDKGAYTELKVYVGDADEALQRPIYTCSDFIHALVTEGGGQFKACIRTNLTGFGLSLCVLDDADVPVHRDKDQVEDPTDGSRRFQYTQIPLVFCSRTGVVCPFTGSSVNQLSAHSGVEWHFIDNKLLGPGEFIVTFYTGVEGFTGFKPGGEWDRPWVRECDRIRELSYEEAIQAADLSACEAVCSNVCVRLWKHPFGGYGGLGVCADSVALIEHVLRGRTTIFPLFMRGDAKTGLLYVMREHIRGRVSAALADEQQFAATDVRSQRMSEFLDLMARIARSLIRLPNDIQVEPHEVLDSLDRIYACTMESPFQADLYERNRMKSIMDGWSKALTEFETDFAEVARTKHELLRRMPSSWRLSSTT